MSKRSNHHRNFLNKCRLPEERLWFLEDALEDMASNLEFHNKAEIDDDFEQEYIPPVLHNRKVHMCSWQKKRLFKKKMVRRFLSINPAMHYERVDGVRACHGFFVKAPRYYEYGFYDPQKEYFFNTYNGIFLSSRGGLRRCQGKIFASGRVFAIGPVDTFISKITNARIRRHPVDDEIPLNHAYARKYFSPLVDDF